MLISGIAVISVVCAAFALIYARIDDDVGSYFLSAISSLLAVIVLAYQTLI